MTAPLVIKRPKKASLSKNIRLIFTGVIPASYLLFLLLKGGDFFFPDPALNKVAYFSFFFAIPLMFQMSLYISYEFKENDENTLWNATYLSSFRDSWWMLLMLLPAPILGMLVLFNFLLDTRELSTPALTALLNFIMVNIFIMIYWNIFKMRSQIRISRDGLWVGMRFLECGQIHHVSKSGVRYELYHVINPKIPLSCFRLEINNASLFEEYLVKNKIPIVNTKTPLLIAVKLAVAGGAVLIFLLGSFLLFEGLLRAVPVILIAFLLGLIGTHLIENVRKINEIPLLKPKVEMPARTND